MSTVETLRSSAQMVQLDMSLPRPRHHGEGSVINLCPTTKESAVVCLARFGLGGMERREEKREESQEHTL